MISAALALEAASSSTRRTDRLRLAASAYCAAGAGDHPMAKTASAMIIALHARTSGGLDALIRELAREAIQVAANCRLGLWVDGDPLRAAEFAADLRFVLRAVTHLPGSEEWDDAGVHLWAAADDLEAALTGDAFRRYRALLAACDTEGYAFDAASRAQ